MKCFEVIVTLCFIIPATGLMAGGADSEGLVTLQAKVSDMELMLPMQTGNVKATIRTVSVDKVDSKRQIVVVPSLGLVWAGLSCDRYVCFTNAIVGIKADIDRLLLSRQTTHVPEGPAEQSQTLSSIESKLRSKIKAGTHDEIDVLYLGEKLLGLRGMSPFLPPGERVRPAAAPTIEDIRFKDNQLVIILKGEKDTKVILEFDNTMILVRGKINGKLVYTREP